MVTLYYVFHAGSEEPFDESHCHSDGNECKCIHNLYSSILKEHLVHFAIDDTGKHAREIVEALFQCLESMLNCESELFPSPPPPPPPSLSLSLSLLSLSFPSS